MVTGGYAETGITNASSATLTVNGTCQSSTVQPAIGIGSTAQITRLSGPFLLGASGNINPVQAASWRWAPTQIPTYLEVATSGGSTKRNMYTADNMPSGGYPTVGNVRQSTVYGPSSEFTGSLAVPAAASVALGVAVGSSIGTAILTEANVRSAIGLSSANLDTQLMAIPAAVWSAATRTLTSTIPSAADVASAVWSAAARTITGGTVDTLTGAPSVPSASAIAASVWSAATRTITGGTVDTLTGAPSVPSASSIAASVWSAAVRTITGGSIDNAPSSAPAADVVASAVRSELSPELTRLANCATVDTTAATVQDALSE
jgi:hypothetical protein